MKPPQFIITLILASICLVLSILVLLQGESGISLQGAVSKQQIELQTEVQKRQDEINRGTQSQQIGTNLLKDIAAASIDPNTGATKNEKLKELLTKNGITVTVNQNAQNAKSSPSPTR
jgi:hypothetical protein